MSWLIESFLNETRECKKTHWHDHPDEYNGMYDASDFKYKKDEEKKDKKSQEDKIAKHHNAQFSADKRDFGKYKDDKGLMDGVHADLAVDHHAKSQGKEYGSDKAYSVSDRWSAQNAVRRHNRKMEKQGKPKLESVDMLVEIMQ